MPQKAQITFTLSKTTRSTEGAERIQANVLQTSRALGASCAPALKKHLKQRREGGSFKLNNCKCRTGRGLNTSLVTDSIWGAEALCPVLLSTPNVSNNSIGSPHMESPQLAQKLAVHTLMIRSSCT